VQISANCLIGKVYLRRRGIGEKRPNQNKFYKSLAEAIFKIAQLKKSLPIQTIVSKVTG
jgi:hypothetical protein